MTTAAVWNLGSSSFQLLICEVGPSNTLRPLVKRRALLDPGLDVGYSGVIPPKRVVAALAAAKRLREGLDIVRPAQV